MKYNITCKHYSLGQDENEKRYDFIVDLNDESEKLDCCLELPVMLYSGVSGDELITEKTFGIYSLYLDDRFKYFSVDNEHKIVSGINVDFVGLKVKNGYLKKPNIYKDALLILNTDEELIQGCGRTIDVNLNFITSDRKNNIFSLGRFDFNKLAYRFLKNAYVQFKTDGNIQAVLVTQ